VQAEKLKAPDLPFSDRPLHSSVLGVEAPLEPDLDEDASPRHVLGKLDRLRHARCEWLLAQDRARTIDRRPHELCMRLWGSRDDCGIDAIQCVEGILGHHPAKLPSEMVSPLQVFVRNDQNVDSFCETSSMQLADRARPDDSDLHLSVPASTT
jgi:hypothetical protein